MDISSAIKKDLYYSNDHEWVYFQGSVAYIGLCRFKLSGIKQIQQIVFTENSGLIKHGDIVATIKWEDYQIPFHMPVDGKIISINEELTTGSTEILLQQPEDKGWIALIVPSQLHEKTGLLSSEEYKFFQEKHKQI